MDFTFAAITDIHFGPRALFQGKLRKMSDLAPSLVAQFHGRIRPLRPELVLALGDLVQDESAEADADRYRACVQMLRAGNTPTRFVAGNHDTIHLSDDLLATAWQHPGPLYYSFDHGPVHFSILRTVERQDVDVTIPSEQLEWLARDLSSSHLPTVVAMHHPASDQDLTGNRWFEKAPHLALIKQRADLRRVIADSKKVVLVINGHLHWNHIDIHDAIPFVTVQSLIENVEDDAPGRVAQAYAVVRIQDRSVSVRFEGEGAMGFALRG